MKHTLLAIIIVVGLSVIAAGAQPVDIGSRRELFVDDLIIGKLDGTKLKMHQPHRLRRTPTRPRRWYTRQPVTSRPRK